MLMHLCVWTDWSVAAVRCMFNADQRVDMDVNLQLLSLHVATIKNLHLMDAQTSDDIFPIARPWLWLHLQVPHLYCPQGQFGCR